jgi:hypothetical protein
MRIRSTPGRGTLVLLRMPAGHGHLNGLTVAA